MNYNVKTVLVPTMVPKKVATYVLLLGEVMKYIDMCDTAEQVQEILKPVEKELRHTMKNHGVRFTVHLTGDGWKPEVTYDSYHNFAITSNYCNGELTITETCFEKIPCIKVDIEHEAVNQDAETNTESEELFLALFNL